MEYLYKTFFHVFQKLFTIILADRNVYLVVENNSVAFYYSYLVKVDDKRTVDAHEYIFR